MECRCSLATGVRLSIDKLRSPELCCAVCTVRAVSLHLYLRRGFSVLRLYRSLLSCVITLIFRVTRVLCKAVKYTH
jgi:hypothetical protein